MLNESHIGDWFVLYQLSKNVDSYFFRSFMKELELELKANPNNLPKTKPPDMNQHKSSRHRKGRGSASLPAPGFLFGSEEMHGGNLSSPVSSCNDVVKAAANDDDLLNI